MNEKNCYQNIKDYMSTQPKGTVFATIDFKDYGTETAVRKALSRLVSEEHCRRILPSIFYCPVYSKLLKKETGPSTYDVAEALARNYKWKLVPSPIHAQNELGISTQVPANVSYTSTGPTRNYVVNGIPITFKQSRSKFVRHMSYKSALVTIALQDLKNFEINDRVPAIISGRLSQDEKRTLQDELHYAPVWLQPYLKRIVAG